MPLRPEQFADARNQQFVAAHDNRGRIRLVAGPGTGKSASIEDRVRWLIQDVGVRPNHIYVVSFTRASARDLQARITKYCLALGIQEIPLVSVTTLHSLGLRVLRAAGQLDDYPTQPMVMDDWEVKNIFDAEFAADTALNPSRCELVRRDHEAFWSTGQWDPPNYIPPDPPINQAERDRFIQFYGPRTQVYSCVLPGEIVRKCVDGINAGTLDPVELLRAEQLIVDEFQDLNPCDIDLIEHFAQSEVGTFVAGDDDQSMYSFRFASPAGIQQFVDGHTAAGDHRLEACLRSAPAVLNAAIALITANSPPGRIPRNLYSLYQVADPPVPGIVRRLRFPSAVAEARALAESCQALIAGGMSPRDILILLSSTDLTERLISQELNDANIPFEPTKRTEFKDSQVGRLALSLLRIVCGENDYVAYRTVLGLLKGVGVGTCNKIANNITLSNLNLKNLFLNPLPAGVFSAREAKALERGQDIVRDLIPLSPTDAISTCFGSLSQLIRAALETNEDDPEWTRLRQAVPDGMTVEEFRDYVWASNDEQQASVLQGCYERLEQPLPEENLIPDRIRIMTMHSSKGLSAKVVFIPSLEREILPGPRRQPYPGLVLEAARMLYVAFTRAQAACIISFSQRRSIYGESVVTHASPFCNHLGGAFQFEQDGMTAAEASAIVEACALL